MGSVYVTWSGSCSDGHVQDELVGFLEELAERNLRRVAGPQVARPLFLAMMTAEREASAAPLEAVRRFDEELAGQTIVDPCVGPNTDAFVQEVDAAGVEKVVIGAGEDRKQEPSVLSLDLSPAQYMLRLKRVRVRGIDFQLYDPRRIYPSADRLSFVFLDAPKLPALTGCLAMVEGHEQCQAYESKVLRDADWYVSTPSIHLRYYLEEWLDMLLAWVKFFFIPDLRYCRYEALSGYEALREQFEEFERSRGREDAKRMVFDYLLERFESEADEWGEKIAGM